RDTLGVKLMLVAERYRFERQDRFARFVHRLDPVLETLRGNDRAELTVGIDYYPYTPCNRYPIDPGDKGVRVRFSSADANGIGLARNTAIAYINIMIAGG